MRGISKNYDAEMDYKQRVEEMRSEWEEWNHHRLRLTEKSSRDDLEHVDALHNDEWNDDVHSYFTRTARNTPVIAPMEKTISSEDEKRA
jgi:alpha-glucuronidase